MNLWKFETNILTLVIIALILYLLVVLIYLKFSLPSIMFVSGVLVSFLSGIYTITLLEKLLSNPEVILLGGYISYLLGRVDVVIAITFVILGLIGSIISAIWSEVQEIRECRLCEIENKLGIREFEDYKYVKRGTKYVISYRNKAYTVRFSWLGTKIIAAVRGVKLK